MRYTSVHCLGRRGSEVQILSPRPLTPYVVITSSDLIKPCSMTQRKAIRANEIYFCSLPWAQGVGGSNPLAPTINPLCSHHFFRSYKTVLYDAEKSYTGQ